MPRHLPTRLAAGAMICGAIMAVGGPSPTSADGPRPGLPNPPTSGGAWSQVVQGGAAEVAKAKQWTRVPMQVSTVYTITKTIPLPPGDPRQQSKEATNYIYLMAEAGARRAYGSTAPFTIHSLAFGSVPVTATVRLAQRRNDEGLPIPMTVMGSDDFYLMADWPAEWPAYTVGRVYHDTHVSEPLNVEIESMTVDGVDLDLQPGCRTVRPATVNLTGKGFISGDPAVVSETELWLSGHYSPGRGGLLSGTVDVPAFSRCTTSSGEDISPLLTSAVSGPDNATTLHVSDPFMACTGAPLPQVGEYDATVLCPDRLPGHVTLPPQQP